MPNNCKEKNEMIRKYRLWLIFCVFLFSTSIAYAGVNEWICKGLHEECVEDLAIDPLTPAIIYAVTFGGVFKSTNGADIWMTIGLSDRVFSSLAIGPLTPATIYTGTDEGVFKINFE